MTRILSWARENENVHARAPSNSVSRQKQRSVTGVLSKNCRLHVFKNSSPATGVGRAGAAGGGLRASAAADDDAHAAEATAATTRRAPCMAWRTCVSSHRKRLSGCVFGPTTCADSWLPWRIQRTAIASIPGFGVGAARRPCSGALGSQE